MSFAIVIDDAIHETLCLAVWTVVFVAHVARPKHTDLSPDQHAYVASTYADSAEKSLRDRAGRARRDV